MCVFQYVARCLTHEKTRYTGSVLPICNTDGYPVKHCRWAIQWLDIGETELPDGFASRLWQMIRVSFGRISCAFLSK